MSDQTVDIGDSHRRSLLSHFVRGDFGLGLTFWLGIAGIVAINLVILAIPFEPAQLSLSLLQVVYAVLVLLGVASAATKYEGPKVWSALARVFVFLGWFGLITGILGALMSLGS